VKTNRDILVAQLEALPLLAGRYEHQRCVNYDAQTGQKRGCFSLVFSAHDTLLHRKVAIKFFDVHVDVLQDPYRIQGFEREPEILKTILGRERCLQLVADLDQYQLHMRLEDGTLVGTLPCKYFVVEWIDDEIDDFFDRQDQFSGEEKLRLFNEIVLGVEALHRYEIHHRDLKPDNLRAYLSAMKRIIVAIDLGTAARLSSKALAPDYNHPVGAPHYAAPETFCGLSGNRELGPATDAYALGCMLFELFNKDLFVHVVRRAANYNQILAAMCMDLNRIGKKLRLDAWKRNMKRVGKAIPAISIDMPGNSVSPAIRDLLAETVMSLTQFDFQLRERGLARIRHRIWTAIHILQHEAEQHQRQIGREQRKQMRLEKLRSKEQRLAARQASTRQLSC
jgi:serine/threonine protein kinase